MTDMTTCPEKTLRSIRQTLPLVNDLTKQFPITSKDGDASASADFLRNLFPHLDDSTIAGFTAYVVSNLAAVWSEGGQCNDVLILAVVYAHITKQLAWAIETPEAN